MKTTTACALSLAGANLWGCGDNSAKGTCPDEPGVLCTWAGTGDKAFNGDGLPLTESSLYWPVDLTFDPAGHTYLVDWNNHRVREVTPEGTLKTIIGTDFIGDGPEDMSDLSESGAPGTDVHLNHPSQIVPMPDGKPILVSWHNHKLRRYDPDTGLVKVICGGPAGFAGDGGPASTALFNQPNQMVVAEDGTLFVLDQRNQVVRMIDPEGMITTVVGTPQEAGHEGDGGPPGEARLNMPTGSNPPPGGGLALDADGRLYIADTLNHSIRVVDFDKDEIATLAGTGEPGYSGDDGPADEAQLNNPRSLTLGPDGRLYVGDELNHRIRAIDLDSGEITTVAGTGEPDDYGDGGPATEAALNRPVGVAFDEDDAMYIIDTYNGRIRRMPAED